MALGLKFAGTANRNAFKTLYNYAQMFTALSHKTIAELAGKSTIETCLNVTLLSAAVVMAGTGNLEVNLIRELLVIHELCNVFVFVNLFILNCIDYENMSTHKNSCGPCE